MGSIISYAVIPPAALVAPGDTARVWAVTVQRGALVVAVSRFGSTTAAEETTLVPWTDLPYAAELGEELEGVLGRLGYVVDRPTEPADLKGKRIGARVVRHLRSGKADDLRLVHVISHAGPPAVGPGTWIIGGDGESPFDCSVEGWIERVENDSSHHRAALFLLDVCGGGEVLRSTVNVHAEPDERRAVVAAASPAGLRTYDGAFTRAVISLLTDLATRELGLHESVEFLPWGILKGELKRRFPTDAFGKEGRPRFTDLDDDVPLPFFPNPDYAEPGPTEIVRQEALEEQRAFLDGLDVAHFRSRAAAWPTASGVGLFQGRRAQLELLSLFLDANAGGTRIVTGSPGSGKSALLGVVVCAAHPRLRAETRSLWEHVHATPQQVEDVAAVHARQLDLAQVVASIASQLGLPADLSRADRLIEAIRRLRQRPVIIIDAIDEALGHHDLVDVLLRPLRRAVRRDGTPAVTLVIGTRSGPVWPAIDSLVRNRPDEVINLDTVGAEELRHDIRDYARRVLQCSAPFDAAAQVERREWLADRIATALAVHRDSREPTAGAFLVCGVFLSHLLLQAAENGPAAVDTVVERVPRTLPEVFELDLDGDRDGRAVLAALAWAKGDGAPLSVVPALLAAAEPGCDLGRQAIRAALDRHRFYLRTEADIDATALFRLYHEGLADHLRSGDPRRIVEALVGTWSGGRP